VENVIINLEKTFYSLTFHKSRNMGQLIIREYDGIKANLNEIMPYDIAMQECLCAKHNAISVGDVDAAGHASKGLAECYRRIGMIDAAILEYNHALGCFKETKNNSGTAWTRWAYSNLLRQQCDYYESIRQLRAAYVTAITINDNNCVGYIIAGIGENTRILGNYHESKKYHMKALRIFKGMSDYRGIVWAYEGIAQMHKNSGHIYEGLKLFIMSKEIAEKYIDKRGLGFALKGIGEIFGMLGNRNESMNHLRLALNVFVEIGYKVGIAYTYKTMGDTYLRYKDVDNALYCTQQALNIFNETRDKRGIAYAEKTLGDIKYQIGNIDDATEDYLQANTFFISKNIEYGMRISNASLVKIGYR